MRVFTLVWMVATSGYMMGRIGQTHGDTPMWLYATVYGVFMGLLFLAVEWGVSRLRLGVEEDEH